MKIGDSITMRPYIADKCNPIMTGTIMYINKPHRYFTVQFPAGWRQSFKFGGTK